jgi:hypothetical protein
MYHASKEENGRAPRIAVGDVAGDNFCSSTLRLGYRPDLSTCGNHPGFDVAPERDEQLACHGHNGDSPCAPSQRADALAKPHCQLAAGLVAKPEPCELDHGRPSTRVSGAANATIAVHPTALVGHRRDADVACDLPAVVE